MRSMKSGDGEGGGGCLLLPRSRQISTAVIRNVKASFVCWGRVGVVAEVEGAALLSKMTETNAKVEEALTALTAVEAEFEEASKASESLKQQEVELNNQLDDVNLSIRSRKARVG